MSKKKGPKTDSRVRWYLKGDKKGIGLYIKPPYGWYELVRHWHNDEKFDLDEYFDLIERAEGRQPDLSWI